MRLKARFLLFFSPFKVSPYRPGSTSQSFQMANKVSTLCVYQVGDSVLFSTPPPPFHVGNLTPLFRGSGPASHLSYLPLPKLKGRSPCTCKLHPVLTCVARLTCTFVAIDFVDAPPVVAGFALTVIQVHLTIETCRLTRM